MDAAPRDGGLLERARLALTAVALLACGRGPDDAAYAVPGDNGVALTVEVLNGTTRSGLARLGTRMLRRAGVDVVYFGNAHGGGELDSTRIVVRRDAAGAGERVRRVLGLGVVVVRLDSAPLLDATVVLGRDFTPRAEFDP